MAVTAPVRYKVSEFYGKPGIRGPDAAVKYGPRMLTLAEAYPLFGNETLWDANKPLLNEARPFWTRTQVVSVRLPLGETIVKDGKDSFVESALNGIKWRHQIPERFLDGETLRKSGRLFVVENGVTTRQDGANEYTSILNEENDMRVGCIPSFCSTKTTILPFLFGEDISELSVDLVKLGPDVRAGLAGVGYGDSYADLRIERQMVFVPHNSSVRLGVLEYAHEPLSETIQK